MGLFELNSILRFRVEKVVDHRNDRRHAVHQRDVGGVGQNGQSRFWVRMHVAVQISTLETVHLGNVIEPHEYDRFPAFMADPMSRKRNAWSYIDARDLCQIVHLCIEKDGLGYQVFNAVNDTITARDATAAFLEKYCPATPHKRRLEGFEAPISNQKIRDVLGFKEEHDWKKYVKF